MRNSVPAASGSVARGISAALAAAASLPTADDLAEELGCIGEASEKGYFPPDHEERIKLRYMQYLSLRAALLEAVAELGAAAGKDRVEWSERLPVFATAFAAACVLMRATRYVIDVAASRPVLWKKLDEEDLTLGLPKKSFTRIYRAGANASNQRRFLAAADFYFHHREAIRAIEGDGEWRALIALIEREEPSIERRHRDALKRFAGYRWFSFLRKHRSAWRQVMAGFFEVSGRAIAEMRQPGVKPRAAPKRIDADLRAAVLKKARPGDLFVTRHDDAVSNLFLPGYWPHAALYLGSVDEAAAAGVKLPEGLADGPWFLEAKKDGVKIRPAAETLEVDALVVLRPPLEREALAVAMARALGHHGKPYDFLFDFRTADRLACTEVIYRGFHGVGLVEFRLREVGGRLCLPAEELLDQALGCGFRLVCTAGLRGNRMLSGTDAEIAFHGVRQPV